MLKYKIFYSYQSDINKELNDYFIKTVLEEIVRDIKHIKFELLFSFRNSSGQRPLVHHMLESSDSSDIFVGDVTFTSSRTNHVEKNLFKIRNKQYLTRVDGDIKASPNPNVLIETGYSWALKKYERTILIMNEAFGHPDGLPIDMSHVQWPILYKLLKTKAEDPTEYNLQKEELKRTLKTAILNVVKTDQQYLRTHFLPLSIHEDWPKANFQQPFAMSPEIIEKITQYRADLEKPGEIRVIQGAPDSGKSRFAYELFRTQKSTFKEHDNIHNLYYYDMKTGGVAQIHVPLQKLLLRNQYKVIILDNCLDSDLETISKMIRGTNLSLLAIQEKQIP